MQLDCDVVIAGAGFAGLACAREIARRGLEVQVLERKSGAGDGIHTTGILVKEAQEEWAAPKHLVREITRVRVYGPSLRSASVERGDYFFLATDTAGLLEWLQEETRKLGVKIGLGEPFSGATRQSAHRVEGAVDIPDGLHSFSAAARRQGHWVLEGAGTTCRFLVGADGARSQVAKSLGLDRNTRYLKGVEYAYEPLPDAEVSLHCFVDREFAPGYIGWVLPGVGVTQVGLACRSAHTADLPGFIRRIDPLFGLSERTILEKRGGIIPIGGLLPRFHGDGVMLLGDAAGMVSPLTAGGIHRALLFGRLGGQAIADHLLEGGRHPGDVIRAIYPRRPWQMAARWAYARAPAGAMLEAALRMPHVFRRVAGRIFFDRMSWPE